ncbi:MAG: DUF4359 domain-containing protein [Hormoscilla sp. SP5CHS1]|nr:DUF4359 domain-containing protein [Hormoscilla sp. SP12CHS1]MBC6452672.1 DUF4359 domain-containing protein [Hormoscilla sp. SP5CHS1]MBO1348330.1 DUF4359 domain-containing protein [Hormoscilla sp. GUM202]
MIEMKALQVVGIAGGAALIAAMAMNNPGRTAYEEFATQELSAYVQENVCTQGEASFRDILQAQCKKLVKSLQPQLQTIIAENTERNNWRLFSIYKTELYLADFLLSYEFGTVGVLGNLYIYKTEEK